MSQSTPFNRFAQNSSLSDTIPGAPAAENEALDLAPESESEVDPVTGKKVRKASKKREKPNAIMTKEQKLEMVNRYENETPAQIGRDMGFEARQVYNAVRHARLTLQAALKVETDPTKIERLNAMLAKIPNKEFGGGAAGPRSNTLTDEDILKLLG